MKLNIDAETKRFIQEHQIADELLFNAEGQPVGRVKNEMKRTRKYFAFNTTPCQKGGHRFRDKYTHCIICDPAKISYALRNLKPSWVYVFGSRVGQVIKIGITSEAIEKRLSKLNSRKIGQIDDWVFLKAVRVLEPQKLEDAIHSKLKPFRRSGIFYDGQESSEIFNCNYLKALDCLKETLEDHSTKPNETKSGVFDLSEYNFRNLKRKLQ